MPDPAPAAPEPRPPLGGWPRVYALVCVLAIAVMALLWWFTSRYDLPLGKP